MKKKHFFFEITMIHKSKRHFLNWWKIRIGEFFFFDGSDKNKCQSDIKKIILIYEPTLRKQKWL